MALDVKGVMDGGLGREEALGGSWRFEALYFLLPASFKAVMIVSHKNR
jgi:hypothetical protein